MTETMEAEKRKKSAVVSVRITEALKDRVRSATEVGPICVTLTSLIERGLILACEEMEQINAERRLSR